MRDDRRLGGDRFINGIGCSQSDTEPEYAVPALVPPANTAANRAAEAELFAWLEDAD